MAFNEINDHLTVPSLQRHFEGNHSKTPQTLHVLQWNTLAQGLSNPDRNFIRIKQETVAYETRRWRILEQIVMRQPDLCSLEEVDTYESFLQHQLPTYGYTCHYVPKSRSPCLAFQHDTINFKGPDGILLCYRTELFDEIKRHQCEEKFETGEGKQFFASLELKHKSSNASIVFVGTHLKAKKPFASVREKQAQGIVNYLSEQYPTRTHIIVVGDCNGEPNESFYGIFRQAGFSSAYQTMLNGVEPTFTTWKFREHDGIEDEQCRCIDYIFYKPEGFSPNAILKLSTKEEIGPNGLPANHYPSDHLALEAIFEIKP